MYTSIGQQYEYSVPTFVIGIDPVWGGGNSFADCHLLLPGNGGGGVRGSDLQAQLE